MSKALIVENLSKSVSNNQILKSVSFDVEHGSFCAFIGPNGAGKTTTIRSIMGLFPYTQGKITILDKDGKDIESRMKVGYVIEKENFFHVTARQFLYDMASYYDVKSEVVTQRIDELSILFNIQDKLDDRLDKMSSGQKKKIMIIQALVHNPDLIIMDEPTENLDPDTREVFYKLINQMKSENKTIFISTHNLDEIEHYVDYIIILGSGEIKYTGKWSGNGNLREKYNQFKQTGVAQFHIETPTPTSTTNKYDEMVKKNLLTKEEAEILKQKL